MEHHINVYAKDRNRGSIYLGRTTVTGSDTVGEVETRIIRDVLADVEGIGRTTPFDMTAVHLNGKRHDDNVNFRDPKQLFTDAIKNSHSSVYEYNDFNVIIEVHDGYYSESNRSSTSSNGSNSESNRSSPGRSRSRSSNRSKRGRSKSRSSSTSKRGRSKSRSSSTSKRGRSTSRSTNHTRKRVTL